MFFAVYLCLYQQTPSKNKSLEKPVGFTGGPSQLTGPLETTFSEIQITTETIPLKKWIWTHLHKIGHFVQTSMCRKFCMKQKNIIAALFLFQIVHQ